MGTATDADLILKNGVVYTVDARRSRHEAVALRDGRIAAVGSAADIAALRGPRTEVVDLRGRLELPAERLHEAAVELTVFRGAPVHASGAFEGLAGA